jgi:hypothetical protein
VHRSLGEKIKTDGGDVLSPTVLSVAAKGKARVYCPRRTLAGTLTPALTWGVFGLVTSGSVTSLVAWTLLGALLGGLCAYFTEHLRTNDDLARLGEYLASDSSVILSFATSSAQPRVRWPSPNPTLSPGLGTVDRWSAAGPEELVLGFVRFPPGIALRA